MRELALAAAITAAALSMPVAGGAAAPGPVSAVPSTGSLVVTFAGVRSMPSGTTELRFSGSVALGSPPVFTETRPPQPRVLLDAVPLEVAVLTIEYLDGSTLVGLFEGYVRIDPRRPAVLANPPWITQPPCHTPAPDELGLFGADLDRLAAKTNPIALPPRALPILGKRQRFNHPPSRAIIEDLPPVGMQGTLGALGSPGSCISWSFAYGLGSSVAARRPDGTVRLDLGNPQNQVSPAFLYALVHTEEVPQAFCPTGSDSGYLEQLVKVGAPSVAQVPYAPDCCYINDMDVTRQFPREGRLRIGSYAEIPLPGPGSHADPAPVLRILKEYLAAGFPVAFAGLVFTNFGKELPLDHGVYYAPFVPPTCTHTAATPCGHGMLLVGYDDTLGNPTKPGAFLVQNSFGTNWPPGGAAPAPPGMFYLSYDAFFASQNNAQVAYPLDRSALTAPPLTSLPSGGPSAYVTLGYEWVDVLASGGSLPAYLILLHHFSEPMTLLSVTLAEPAPSTARVTQRNDYPMADGYTYLVRNDGKGWLRGEYRVTIDAIDAAGQLFTYTGGVPILSSRPPVRSLPRATMPAHVIGTIGATLPVER